MGGVVSLRLHVGSGTRFKTITNFFKTLVTLYLCNLKVQNIFKQYFMVYSFIEIAFLVIKFSLQNGTTLFAVV